MSFLKISFSYKELNSKSIYLQMSEVLNEDIDQLGSNRTDIITTTLKCTNLLRSWVSLEKVTFWNKNDSLMKILLCVCAIGFVGFFLNSWSTNRLFSLKLLWRVTCTTILYW